MSNIAKVAGAAANTLTTPLNVEDVFSTYLYDGTGSALTVTNDINLSDEGGMVWVKRRDTAVNHYIFDTERGVGNYIITNSTAAQNNLEGISAFNTNGFSVGTAISTGMNTSGGDYASWTFRKAPKFFDVVTYTGDGANSRTISHDLGADVGMVIIKRTDSTSSWAVWHRGLTQSGGTGGGAYNLVLEATNAQFSTSYINSTTSSSFTVGGGVGFFNNSGATFVAYLFAHNNGDGGFGPNGDQDIIKCGSFTANSGGEVEIDVGFEPQWILTKSTASSGWFVFDAMRGMSHTATNSLQANESNAEQALTTGYVKPTATGWIDSFYGGTPEIIYIAIRRGPMAVPESATDVFATETQGATTPNPPAFTSGFEVDAALFKLTNSPQSWHLAPRLTQNKYMFTDLSDAEQTNSAYDFDFNNGWYDSASGNSAFRSWMWKRAPSFFDVVCYTGNGSAGHTVSHNLGVAPEMMWVKRRNGTGSWAVYHAGIASDAETDYIYLDYNFSANDDATFWNDTAPTASDFTLGNISGVNSNTQTYIAYLFASLAGISKVGSYTGNNTSQTIDCGFSAGARFVIIKRTDFSGSWYLWDSARGIVDGNDPYLLLDTNGAEVSSYDWIDPDNSGFIVNSTTVNASSGNYIFYAIA